VAPLAPHEKVLVSNDFLESTHGSIACVDCHGGDNDAPEMAAAHRGMKADPTFPDATGACGECHAEQARLAQSSLHYTLATFKPMVHQRAGQDKARLQALDQGLDNHCYSCHASCGECHVSRPNFAKGGFISGHNFNRVPDQTNQCTACHGSRVGNEFTGMTGSGDVHYTRHDMDCMACHSDKDLHGDGRTDHKDRYDVEGLANCKDCHEQDDSVEQHAIHGDQVSCYVCHAQPYANCYGCHVGLDGNGLAYYKNPVEEELFRIGLNPNPSEKRPEKWVVVRRVPAMPTSFDYYGKDLLENFDRLNNWKYASPHNIQRRTRQNRACNNCHGNEELFLTEEKVGETLRKANEGVIVPAAMIPAARADVGKKKAKKKKGGYF
jgi:thiosulfate/3-mercaptopyruvate sulfurtransferase